MANEHDTEIANKYRFKKKKKEKRKKKKSTLTKALAKLKQETALGERKRNKDEFKTWNMYKY